MPLVSAIFGSSQVSKAVGSQVGAANTAIGDIAGATTAGQGYLTGAVNQGQTAINQATGGANDILAGVNSSEQQNLNPYLQLGQTGVNNLNTALAPGGSLTSQFSFDPTQIANNPDYQFQLQQGNQAVQRAAAANGTLMGGGTLKALDSYSQGLASNEIGQAFNQALAGFQANRQNNLTALTLPLNVGQNATGQSQSAYQNYGNLSGQNLTTGAAQDAGLGLTGANLNANLGYKGAQDTSNLLTQIGNIKASGSIAQNGIWGPLLGSAASQGMNALGPTVANATGGNPGVAGVWNALAGLGG
jgi:hypothetical protein